MMHSLKYDYYKLPGGGIEEGESLEDTLGREVREESGLFVKRDSIKEFGYVRRIEKGKYEDIFIQENFYFLCEVEEQMEVQQLDDYEEEERFVLEFVSPEHAVEVNANADHGEKMAVSDHQPHHGRQKPASERGTGYDPDRPCRLVSCTYL